MWDPAGKHCYLTGGSSGLGLELALLLTARGAHVSIVARGQERLDAALRKLEEARANENQILRAYSYTLETSEGAEAALADAVRAHGGAAPDALLLCAGSSRPGFFVEATAAEMSRGMDLAYWVQAWPAWAGARMMVRQKAPGKIVFVASTLGYMSFIGYSTYSPGKHALRGLADTLRSEMLLYNVDVQIFSPPTIFTPGYEEENKTKPAITLKIEEADAGLTAAACAASMLSGIEGGNAHLAGDFITNVFRTTTRGSAPASNTLVDVVFDCIGWIAVPFWRRGVDARVRAHREEHREYLQTKGFFAQ